MQGSKEMTAIQNKRGIDLHIRELLAEKQASSIIFCCTPLVSVDFLEVCYLPLYERGFNVFAIDFAGTGKSGGDVSDFTVDGIIDDFESLVIHVQARTSGNIYLFADAGIGGIIGQYYMGGQTEIKGFAQFAVGIYRDISALGMPRAIATMCLPIVALLCKVFPKLCLTIKPPQYEGYHAELDNSYYDELYSKDRNFYRVSIHFVRVLLEILISKKSRLSQLPEIPTLVFKTTYDRYFPPEYFDRYFEALQCYKKLYVVEDVHNSYALYPDLFASEVADWFFDLDNYL